VKPWVSSIPISSQIASNNSSNMVKEIGTDLAPNGIRVVGVAPGAIAAPGEEDLTNTDVPLGRSGTPEDVAQLMLWLATDEAKYITATTITIAGGLDVETVNTLRKRGMMPR
jgi:NAD(P)-dependent dehydrogenase (short-subunit alcohol dehydrogenase family)